MASTDLVNIRTEGNPNISDAPPPKSWEGDVSRLEQLLKLRVRGEVRFSAADRAMYATDGSNYRQVPICIVIPRDKQDVIEAVAACREVGAPILARGGGTSLAGQCCNVAVVLDFSKYMNRILEINKEECYAVVEPGVILDHLRDEATKVGLTYGPDPATHNHCTLGGMIGNNSCGVHSIISGRTSDNVYELEVLLYDGTIMRVGQTSPDELERIIAGGERRGQIYRELRDLRDRYSNIVKEKFPNIPRRVSGFDLTALLPENNFDVAKALVGSESTCALVLEAKLKLITNPTYRTLVVLGYSDVYKAGDHVKEIMKYGPIGLEGIDSQLVEFMKKKNLRVHDLHLLPEGKGWLLVEFGSHDSQAEADAKARHMIESLKGLPDAPTAKYYDNKRQEKLVWEIRESGLGATAFVPGEPLGWEGWEDSAVDPAQIGQYLRELCSLMNEYGYRSAMYGHFGHGCVHMRINFDLCSAEGIAKYRKFIHEAAKLVVKYGGSLSGEHGDGQSRGELLPIMFGNELMQAFEDFKRIWDPDWKMNPGKLVKAYRTDENLRLGVGYKPWEPQTHFHFTQDGGKFAHAVMRCVGVGECRRTEGKTMCPSFRVTMEEKHSTRGRAHLLWEMCKGDVITDGWKNEDIHDSLELCLACKGCRGDCPVNVDVSTYKAEFYSHYYEGRIRPRHAYAFGYVDLSAALGSKIPGLANLVTQTPGIADIAKYVAGLTGERDIPPLAAESFVSWWSKRPKKSSRTKRVLLWPDTFNNYFTPGTSRAAVEVLEHAGFEVIVPTERVCCGRPLYDFGMLDRAKSLLRHTLDVIGEEVARGTEVVGLEPSCVSVFRDELTNLFPYDERAKALQRQTKFWEEFFAEHEQEFPWPRMERKAVVHGHCHQKAMSHMEKAGDVLNHLGMNYELPQNGCCGLAGSFGFEREKHPLSVKIAANELKQIHSADDNTFIVANGFSCREQIKHTADRRALHMAEVMQMALHNGPNGPGPGRPEQAIVDAEKAETKKTMLQAGTGLAALAGMAIGALLWKKR